MKRLHWISLSYATFGVETENGHVVEAAPIARWMIGKHITWVAKWAWEKGGRFMSLNDGQWREYFPKK